jgi:hypothetical protein
LLGESPQVGHSDRAGEQLQQRRVVGGVAHEYELVAPRIEVDDALEIAEQTEV